VKRFDRKFGADFLSGLPQSPGVYLFKDAAGEVLYTGKAKNIRRRLSDYRNAGRRKAHRKMRSIVREAHAIEIRPQASEAEALLVENQLIRELRPRYNVDGAFEFLYPAIGTGHHDRRLVLCFTSEPELFEALDLRWHGTFRPRRRARDAFDSLVELFGRLGHVEPNSRLPSAPRRKGSRLVAFRRLPEDLLKRTRCFLDGEDDGLLAMLSTELIECPEARRMAAQVEEALRDLDDFYRDDVTRLRVARIATGRSQHFVPRDERDSLFIRTRLESPPHAGD
jgi:predicted GIY-YIG superfamily endonuclease